MPYQLHYRMADGSLLIGGVRESRSSVFSHREDAESLLSVYQSIQPGVVGEIKFTSAKSEIRRCCPGYPAQVAGMPCFGCRRKIGYPVKD